MAGALTFVDLFCGAGGWTQGLVAAGLRHLVGIDKDAAALETYNENHGEHASMQADVAEVDARAIRKKIGAQSVDVVFASPPCQSFSASGPRRLGDPADRLAESVPRIAHGLGAHTVVLENVSGMASKKNVAGELVVDGILKSFRATGFTNIHWELLRCDLFGVPQTRKRVLLIACKGKRTDPSTLFPAPDAVSNVPPLKKLLTPRGQVKDPFYWMDARKAKYYEDRHSNPETRAYVKFVDLDKVANTVRASYAKSRGAEALVRYKDGAMRMLTERECARIQSFPDNYVFKGPRTKVYLQIGNAVPPEFARRIGARVQEVLGRA